MTTRVEGGLTYTQVFDAENRLISVTVGGQTTQFTYDGDSNLVKKVNPDGSRTIHIGGMYEVNKNAAGSVTGTNTYYPAGGAMRVNGTLYYSLKDHLGSASVVTNTSGVTVGEARYYPFGETRLTTGTMNTDRLYTGQREIAGLGIYHYGARFYSPKLGRFLNADTIVPNMANPQDLNRYSYVRNNPVRYIDPSGHFVCSRERTSNDYCPGHSPTPTTSSYVPTGDRPCISNWCDPNRDRDEPSGGTPTVTSTPQPQVVPQPSETPSTLSVSLPVSSGGTPNPFVTYPPFVSTQTPTPPSPTPFVYLGNLSATPALPPQAIIVPLAPVTPSTPMPPFSTYVYRPPSDIARQCLDNTACIEEFFEIAEEVMQRGGLAPDSPASGNPFSQFIPPSNYEPIYSGRR